MKVLITVFDIQDYGGIITHTELLIHGLRKLGHEVEFRILRNTVKEPYRMSYASGQRAQGARPSFVGEGVLVNQEGGWRGATVMGYGSEHRLTEWRKYANTFDLVIHELPVPVADPEGFWRQLYQRVKPPQIAIAHDAHFRNLYPHMIHIAEYLTGVACTNHAGYRALEHLPVPRAFIGSGHLPRPWTKQKKWEERPKRFVSAHIFKRWKHMDLVIKAIPHLHKSVQYLIGGEGIERRYMTSVDKCRDAYKVAGVPIWQTAVKAGMKFAGEIEQTALLEEYEKSRLMVDMSYSKKFAELGNHFNRSTFDAYNGGCIPLVTSQNMAEQPSQRSLFQIGETHLEVDAHIGQEALAIAIKDSLDMSPAVAKRIVSNGRDLLNEFFHYMKSAEAYIRLAQGKSAGIYKKLETGKLTPEIKEAAKKHLSSTTTEEQ